MHNLILESKKTGLADYYKLYFLAARYIWHIPQKKSFLFCGLKIHPNHFPTLRYLERVEKGKILTYFSLKALGKDPENIKLIMQATNTLAGLVKTSYKITKEQRKGLKEAIGNVLREVALPLGIGIGSAIDK